MPRHFEQREFKESNDATRSQGKARNYQQNANPYSNRSG